MEENPEEMGTRNKERRLGESLRKKEGKLGKCRMSNTLRTSFRRRDYRGREGIRNSRRFPAPKDMRLDTDLSPDPGEE